MKNNTSKLVVFSPIFMADTNISFAYNFVVPLTNIILKTSFIYVTEIKIIETENVSIQSHYFQQLANDSVKISRIP